MAIAGINFDKILVEKLKPIEAPFEDKFKSFINRHYKGKRH